MTQCSELDNKRDDGSRVPQKKPRRSEINFLPDNPVGLDDAALEHEREQLKLEAKKKNMDMTKLNDKMETTFPLRRKEIVNEQPMVSVIKERWPGLFLEEQVSYNLSVHHIVLIVYRFYCSQIFFLSFPQVCREFQRITCVNLKTAFMTALNKYSNALIKMYRAKSKDLGGDMKMILDRFDEQV